MRIARRLALGHTGRDLVPGREQHRRRLLLPRQARGHDHFLAQELGLRGLLVLHRPARRRPAQQDHGRKRAELPARLRMARVPRHAVETAMGKLERIIGPIGQETGQIHRLAARTSPV